MKKLNKKGFSLVELIIVIAIMAVLVGVLAPTYLNWVKRSKLSTDVQNAQSMATEIAVKVATGEATGAGVSVNDTWTEIPASGLVAQKPAVKGGVGDSKWYYYYKDSTVHIAIGAANDDNEVYPTIPTGSAYENIATK